MSFDGLSLGLDGPSRPITSDDRLIPVSRAALAFGGELPSGTLILESKDRRDEVVVTCPMTGVPMTREMARAVELERHDLQNMVDRLAPLGLSPEQWIRVSNQLFDALDKAGLDDSDLIVKVGGSSTHGFSSQETYRTKRGKRMPTTAEQLHDGVANRASMGSLNNPADIKLAIRRAERVWTEATRTLPRQPKSPWWGILHQLGLEDRPDVDIQIHSPKVDQRMHQGEEVAELARHSRRSDRLDRWPTLAVEHEFEPLDRLRRQLARNYLPVDLEFLADREGRDRIIARQDWWTVTRSGPTS